MANGQAGTVLRYLRRFIGRQAGEEALDQQLLVRFAATREEAAFEALVRRHGTMVLGVCRRIAQNDADAEDAFQATFLVLARKAPSIRNPERLANWLYGVAFRTARSARAASRRRSAREKELAEMPVDRPLEEKARRELRWTLDEELVRLPDKYRLPLVLCYLEGRTKEEAAQLLGWPHGTVSTRLARGRDLLRGRLALKGLALPAAFLACFLLEESALAVVPQALAASTIQSAILFASSQALAAGVVSAPVAALTQGVLKAMFMTKLKLTTAALLTVTLLGTGASVFTYQALAGNQPASGGATGSTTAPGAAPEPRAGGAADEAPRPSEPGTTQPAEKVEPTIRTARDLRKALSQPKEMDEIPAGTPLRDALDALSARHGITIRIDYADVARSGHGDAKGLDQQQVGLRAGKKSSLAVALEDLLSQVVVAEGVTPSPSLTYMVKGKQVVIIPSTRLVPAEQGGTALREPVQVQADGTTLEEALRELAEATGANIVLDIRLGEKSQARVSASLQHVPLETAVRLLADMADVKAVTSENVIYVTTQENAAKWLKEQRERELGFDPNMQGGPLGGGLGGLGGGLGGSGPAPAGPGGAQPAGKGP